MTRGVVRDVVRLEGYMSLNDWDRDGALVQRNGVTSAMTTVFLGGSLR